MRGGICGFGVDGGKLAVGVRIGGLGIWALERDWRIGWVDGVILGVGNACVACFAE